MSHPNTWSTVAIGALPDAGKLTIVDTDGVTKTVNLGDFKKRLISTTDIAWMTGGLTNVDSLAAGDYLFAWDATANKIVTITRNAVLNHLLGTEDVSWMTPLASGDVDVSADTFIVVDTNASGKKLKTLLIQDIINGAIGGVFNVKRFGALGNDSANDTSAVQAAITAAMAAGGGQVYFPPGIYRCGPLVQTGAGYISYRGVGIGGTTLKFVPTANNQTLLKIGNVGGVVCRFNRITDMYMTTTDTTWNKTCIHLIDCGETTIDKVYIGAFYGDADIVGLYTQGRESLWFGNLQINATVPIRIGVNPNTTSGYLSADGVTFNNTYLNAESGNTPASLVSASVLIDNGAHVSNLVFNGSQNWVYSDYGLYWNMTSDTYAYCSSLRLENVRTEQGSLATAYSVYINARTNTPLENLSLQNCEFDTQREGVYTRNVHHQTWNACLARAPSPRIIANIGTAKGMSWQNVFTLATASAAGIVTDANLYLAHAAPMASGEVLPHTATWSRRNTAATYNERPARQMSAHTWHWGGTLADDATVNLPCMNGNDWECAKISVVAVIEGSNVLEYGEWYSAPVTGLTNGIVKASGSANTAVTDSDTDLCVWNDGSPGDAVYVKNRLGGTAYVTIEVVGKRSVET